MIKQQSVNNIPKPKLQIMHDNIDANPSQYSDYGVSKNDNSPLKLGLSSTFKKSNNTFNKQILKTHHQRDDSSSSLIDLVKLQN